MSKNAVVNKKLGTTARIIRSYILAANNDRSKGLPQGSSERSARLAAVLSQRS